MSKQFQLVVTLQDSAPIATMRKIGALPGVLKIDFVEPKAKAPRPKDTGKRFNGAEEGHTLVGKSLLGVAKISRQELMERFEAAGRSPKSVGSVCDNMVQNAMIRRVGTGVYAITAKGKKFYSQPKEAA